MNRYVTKQGTDTESSSQASPEETDSSAQSLDEHSSSGSDSSSNEESSSSHSPSVSSDSPSNEESSFSHSPSVSSVSGPSPQRSSPSSDSSSSSPSFPSRNNASPEPRRSLDGLQSPPAPGRSASEAVPLSQTIPLDLGDLVWAYIPGYPLWPALITQDPVSSVHTKTKSVGRTKIRIFHVEF
ncbi:cell wall protein IFF6-like [Daphnia pulicaria]|uniref:cell wall protein IFF6-like n=1 Tax=Daphnia pulicaria TaxID=35523 RepID=UPI001EECC4C8|nr:cell wall protein IFF6-like [Daphnia pulicaria]